MSASVQPESVAVVCDESGDDAKAVRAFLSIEALDEVRWFGRGGVDDVDRGVRSGGIVRVVFPRQAVLLEAMWSGEVDFEAWRRAGVRIDVVESSSAISEGQLVTIAASWKRWRCGQRRRQAVAGVVLSAVAVACAFGLIYLAG